MKFSCSPLPPPDGLRRVAWKYYRTVDQSVESDTSRLLRIAHLNCTNSVEHFPEGRRMFCRARNILEPGHLWIATGSTSDCRLVRPARIDIGLTSDRNREILRKLENPPHGFPIPACAAISINCFCKQPFTRRVIQFSEWDNQICFWDNHHDLVFETTIWFLRQLSGFWDNYLIFITTVTSTGCIFQVNWQAHSIYHQRSFSFALLLESIDFVPVNMNSPRRAH